MPEFDSLTGVYNLKSFIEECGKILHGSDKKFAMASMDISNFKIINDFYGMDKADELVIAFSKWLRNTERCIIVARTVGDQFRALFDLEGITIEELARNIADSNKKFYRSMYSEFSETMWHIYSAIYYITDNDGRVRNMIDKAHYAKKSMKGNYDQICAIYSDEQFSEYANSINVVKIFEMASEAKENIIINFQPKYSIGGSNIIGAEALGRLREQNGSVIMPDCFVPILEKTRLITRFDAIVMEKTFEIIREWLDEGIEVVPISVNVSRVQMFDQTFAEKVLNLQKKYNIPSELIEIEITESVFSGELDETFSAIEVLRNAGIRIDLDDFGSGYTSFNMMGCLPADTIKLDCGFVRKSLNTESGKTIIESVIAMLQKVGFKVICEGIETLEEAKQIKDFGCDYAQGFYFDKPMQVEEFKNKLLKK